MTSNLYCIYDNVAQTTWGNTIRANNDEVARRAFHDALRTPDGPFTNHQADFDLILVGTIDDQGHITHTRNANNPPDIIARGADWLAANTATTKPEILK